MIFKKYWQITLGYRSFFSHPSWWFYITLYCSYLTAAHLIVKPFCIKVVITQSNQNAQTSYTYCWNLHNLHLPVMSMFLTSIQGKYLQIHFKVDISVFLSFKMNPAGCNKYIPGKSAKRKPKQLLQHEL